MQTQVTKSKSSSNVGTLLWIGPRDGVEFSPSHEFCEQVASQIAWRHSVDEALRRPASDVRCIVIAQSNRAPIEPALLEQLADLYPDAARLNLLGSLCEGVCRYPVAFFGNDRHYWHRWNQFLPGLMRSCGVVDEPTHRAASVLILAARFSDAETLLDLAESTGVTAIWSRTIDTNRVRNVDAIWWDDSVAPAAPACQWSARIELASAASARHAWIANGVRADQIQSAIAGGVNFVVSKPFRIDPLIEMLNFGRENASQTAIVRAA